MLISFDSQGSLFQLDQLDGRLVDLQIYLIVLCNPRSSFVIWVRRQIPRRLVGSALVVLGRRIGMPLDPLGDCWRLVKYVSSMEIHW
jgi:hypothetical protein